MKDHFTIAFMGEPFWFIPQRSEIATGYFWGFWFFGWEKTPPKERKGKPQK